MKSLLDFLPQIPGNILMRFSDFMNVPRRDWKKPKLLKAFLRRSLKEENGKLYSAVAGEARRSSK